MSKKINGCKCGRRTKIQKLSGSAYFQILCEECGFGFYGTSEAEIIQKWNNLNKLEDGDADNNQRL